MARFMRATASTSSGEMDVLMVEDPEGHLRPTSAVEDELWAALELIGAQQQKTLKVIESNGFVFDNIGNEPGNWQHLAFTIYTDLCEIDTIAKAALK